MAGFKLDLENNKIIAGKGSARKGLSNMEAIEKYVQWIADNPHRIDRINQTAGKLFAYIDPDTGHIETYGKAGEGCVLEIHFLEPSKDQKKRMSWKREVVAYAKKFLSEQEVIDERQKSETVETDSLRRACDELGWTQIFFGGTQERGPSDVHYCGQVQASVSTHEAKNL